MQLMKREFIKINYVLVTSTCLLALVFAACGRRAPSVEYITKQELPLINLSDKITGINAYQYLGSWILPSRNEAESKSIHYWQDAVHVNYAKNKKDFRIDSSMTKLNGAARQQLMPDVEAKVFEKIKWQPNQVSVFAFRCISPKKLLR